MTILETEQRRTCEVQAAIQETETLGAQFDVAYAEQRQRIADMKGRQAIADTTVEDLRADVARLEAEKADLRRQLVEADKLRVHANTLASNASTGLRVFGEAFQDVLEQALGKGSNLALGIQLQGSILMERHVRVHLRALMSTTTTGHAPTSGPAVNAADPNGPVYNAPMAGLRVVR